MQLKSSSPSPAPVITPPVTTVVAVVPIFPFQLLAPVGAGADADPSGMPGRQCCARFTTATSAQIN